MPTLIDFRRRIRSVKNTQQITRAMKFVAAAKLRRSQEAVFAARPYARAIRQVLQSAMARIEEPQHPLLARRPEERILLLLASGDKGLCGAFNTNVIRKGLEFGLEHAGKKLGIVAAGKKGRDALRKRRFNLIAEYVSVSARPDFSHAKEISGKIIAAYSAEEVDAVYAIYNEFKSVLAQRLIAEKLLPIDEGELQKPAPATLVDYIYEQPAGEILNSLLPRHIEAQVFRILLESAAAENAARMTAMDSATNNAAELIESITLHMNKVRQASITREIIEIVSGAASTA
ncbi:MAG TPA: ATP synthase F1 subunit gamma [Candidatus Acidoferrales bacterium]|jgi:F-type H+-transporting ATPase subunit gamma|nr:ATP synthase F1 subunit gamma [Candidatus Acidoferrales bacterium]